MSLWSDFEDEMTRLPLDADTADRLLAGAVAPEDAPPGYAEVAVLVAAVAEGFPRDELAREAETVAVLATAVRSSQAEMTKPPRRSFVPRVKLASALVTAALAGTTGLAVAGSLPGAAQDVASAVLANVGISVPGPNSDSGTHPDTRGTSSQPTAPSSSSGKGSEISDLATTTELTGVAKGAAISTAASGGMSQAGQHGQASEEHGAPVATPSEGGTGTADTASGGRSSAGSENAAVGQSRRP